MNIFVIHDFRQKDSELELCETQLGDQGIKDYALLRAVVSGEPTVQDCIAASHKKAVAVAKANDWEEVCVMESDIWFPAPDSWNYFLKNKPQRFDIYSAATYGHLDELRRHHSFRKSFRGPVTLFNAPYLAGIHCYIIHRNYYDTLLSTPAGVHIDVAQEGRGDFRICYPFAALQRPHRSANHRGLVDRTGAPGIVDYNGELTPQDVHGGFQLTL